MAARTKGPPLAPEGVFGSQIVTYATPRGLGDMLFWEAFDSRLPANEKWLYGDPHPDKTMYPQHVLVYVQPGRSQGEQMRWYASRRLCQDEYNWEHSQADVAGTKFNTINRTYILIRSEYDPNVPAQGDLMPNSPAGKFPTAPVWPPVPPNDPMLRTYEYILAGREQHPTGDERIDSLFIIEKRIYIDRAPITASSLDEVLGITVHETTLIFYRNELKSDANGYPILPGEGLQAPGGPYTEFKQLSDNWWSSTTIGPIGPALDAYYKSMPVKVDLGDMPRQLKGISIVWNKSTSIGKQHFAFMNVSTRNSGSLGKDAGDEASSSASITADIQMHFTDFSSQNLHGTKIVFFMKDPVTEEKILARIGAARWPIFHAESSTITVTGQSISVQAHANVGLSGAWENSIPVERGWVKGTSDNFSVGLSVNSVQIPACIHGKIIFNGDTYMSLPVAATAFMQMNHTIAGSISASITKSGTAYGQVYPDKLLPTQGQGTVPTNGIYLIDCDVADYKLGYSKVTAIVFNANQLA